MGISQVGDELQGLDQATRPDFISWQTLFMMGMKRPLGEIFFPSGVVLNLGAGNKLIIPGTIPMDYPEWDADTMPLPFEDETVDGVYAFHFLEHLQNPVNMLREIQRVLRPGGVLTIVVPFGSCSMALHDLDHKHFFNEDTWKTLFDQTYYDKNHEGWKFNVTFNLIAGIVERNLALFTQMVRT